MSKCKKTRIIEPDFSNEATTLNSEEDTETVSDPVMGDDNKKHIELNYKGFKFDFVPARLRDQRVLYILGKLQNESDVTEIMKMQSTFFDCLLGNDALDVMNAVAKVSGGILDEQAFSDFVSYIFESVDQGKNL